MNKPFFWVFLITYFLSFDAAVHNFTAGVVSFTGSILGVTLVAFNSVEQDPN